MSNELETIRENSLGTMYEPATLEVNRYGEMKEIVQGFADKYTNLAFTRDDKKGAEEVRSKLLEIRDKFESERKTIKKAYNEPLNEYEGKIKELNKLIDVPLNQIRDGLKEIENAERSERSEALDTVLEEKYEGLDIEITAMSTWTNAGMWTSKLNPTKKLNEEIDKTIQDAVKEKEYKEAQIKILTEFCKAQEIEAAGWVSQLEHRNAVEVIDLINLEKERKNKLAAEQEQKRIEHEAFLAKQQDELSLMEQAKVSETPFNEPLNNMQHEQVLINVIRVKGTQNQLNNLNEFLINSEIEVEFVADETNAIPYAIDDLPY
ncbi:MAG: DUF1351 domain-containing protein [Carnobacterium inhibens]|uniref:DUF1351 domain-containing protein n=1 Tax=Carnobacterium sp. TaxID=48221 RepID=UPI003315D296